MFEIRVSGVFGGVGGIDSNTLSKYFAYGYKWLVFLM